jgi:hypothetical protein
MTVAQLCPLQVRTLWRASLIAVFSSALVVFCRVSYFVRHRLDEEPS